MGDFSHYSRDGSAKMVDISGKGVTQREARAGTFIRVKPETLDRIRKNLIPKGNVFEVARIAGILAAKRTAEIIPMCHPLLLTYADVQIDIDGDNRGINIESCVRLEGKTGVEMEALVAVSVAALTVYDMCKAVDKEMVIEKVRLLEKKGGKSDLSS